MGEAIWQHCKVENFLIQHKNKWTYYNVPFEDGQALEKLILKNDCKAVLVIVPPQVILPFAGKTK
ncbi:MAG: hypothetical protein M3R72_00945 [Bacteroidota bacterium]|nr:hypothetical protein [Bacteroidota bacterium]